MSETQPTQTPPPPPPPPPSPNRSGWVALAAVVVLALIGAGVVLTATRNGTGQGEVADPSTSPRSTSRPSASTVPSASPSEQSITVTGTLDVGRACPTTSSGILLTMWDDANREVGFAPLEFHQEGQTCTASFSAPVRPADRITFGVAIPEAGPQHTLVGPTYALDRLKGMQEVHLSLEQFAENRLLQQADVEFAKALAAALAYYDAQGTFVGLDAAKMHQLVPSLTFNDEKESIEGEISVREVTSHTFLMVAGLADGVPYCRGAKPPKDGSYGYTDAQTYGECLRWQGTYPNASPAPAMQ